MLIGTVIFVLFAAGFFASVDSQRVGPMKLLPFDKCGKQQCLRDGEAVCGLFNGNHRRFEDRCAMLAHFCDTGEKYQEVRIELCPEPSWPYPCPRTEDVVCVTADNTTYREFHNPCEFMRFQAVLRRHFWRVPLSNCTQPNQPIHGCTMTPGLPFGQVCGYNAQLDIYEIFYSLYDFNHAKCFSDGNWEKASIIYC